MINRLAPILGLAVTLLSGAPAVAVTPPGSSEVSGTIQTVEGSELTVRTRSGTLMKIDLTAAREAHRTALLNAGSSVTAIGRLDASGVLHAAAVTRAKSTPDLWPADH